MRLWDEMMEPSFSKTTIISARIDTPILLELKRYLVMAEA